ncbi:DUF4174 domain-containing protein [Pontibacter sp. E15-1]|uniref:DUF4174 domain-containing protein n=1 Tax=Pontibacter sp. E15-1 TaxID=2919918 RepID=UPI001F4F3DC0|nr:DUF4174 domain-containing protein [Pontibacter sp. E15-1]MCJ8165508.1 DUF4174 domain-containing protein [Pontibacter sp. E15-1]
MKKIVTSLVVIGALLFGLRADAQIRPSAASLEQYKWKKRPLLLFSPSAQDPAYLQQKEVLQQNLQGIRERGMVVIELVGEDKVYVDGILQKRQQGQQLRECFRVAPESFAVLLVGKDGTQKSSSAEPVSMATIFGLIDQMPMRRQEMRGKDNNSIQH